MVERQLPVCLHPVDGATALHHAAWQGHVDLVVFLLNAGAEKDVQARDGF